MLATILGFLHSCCGNSPGPYSKHFSNWVISQHRRIIFTQFESLPSVVQFLLSTQYGTHTLPSSLVWTCWENLLNEKLNCKGVGVAPQMDSRSLPHSGCCFLTRQMECSKYAQSIFLDLIQTNMGLNSCFTSNKRNLSQRGQSICDQDNTSQSWISPHTLCVFTKAALGCEDGSITFAWQA